VADVSPEAMFDCLSICFELEPIAGGAGKGEIANFGYLGCIISFYTRAPQREWGYSFAATKSAAPYSDDLADAVDRLCLSGLLYEGSHGYSLTPRGKNGLATLSRLSRFKGRKAYIDAACQSATAIPLPLVTESLSAEPQLRKALRLSSLRPLLDEAGRHAVLAHFGALAEAVPDSEDLFVPAVVWLAYLARQVEADLAAVSDSAGDVVEEPSD
jgi:hypothetical protein